MILIPTDVLISTRTRGPSTTERMTHIAPRTPKLPAGKTLTPIPEPRTIVVNAARVLHSDARKRNDCHTNGVFSVFGVSRAMTETYGKLARPE